MNYSFDVETAKLYGVDEAIVIHNFQYWLLKNKTENSNQHEGRTWTYNTQKALELLFPFWSRGQVRRVINSLLEHEIIITGNYNKKGYDRTTWYAFKNEAKWLNRAIGRNQPLEVSKSTIAMAEINQPIPDKKHILKTHIKDKKSLPGWINQKSWMEFEEHRKDIRKPLTELARKKNMGILEGLTLDEQEAAIDNTIANRWTGLFKPKTQNTTNQFSRKQDYYDNQEQKLNDINF